MTQTTIRGVHVGDTGTLLQFRLVDQAGSAVNVAGASSRTLLLKPPTGVAVTRSMTYATNGSDGVLNYATTASDFTAAGVWLAQVRVVLPGGSWHSETHKVIVEANLA